MIVVQIIQTLATIGLFFAFYKSLGKLHAELVKVKREHSVGLWACADQIADNKCKFYPQEMPTVKEIHKVVEETTQRQFMQDQYKRVAMQYNDEEKAL